MTDRTSNKTAHLIQHDRQITTDRPVLVDIKDTAAAALNRIDAICAHWLPDGKRQGHDWVARNPTRDDAHAGSFSVSLLTGGCIDHATGDQCHDIVSTIRYLDGLPTQGEAARRLANWMGTTPIIPIPPPTRAKATRAPLAMADRPTRHPQLGAPSATWDYRDAAGNLIGCVWRFETATGKAFRPLTRTPDGWRWKAPEEPRPLYGLDRLAARPDAKVLLCEGEKAADAAGRLLPEAVAITSMNGAQSPGKTDWSPLAGRTVRIWPDHDEPGHQYAKTAAALADRAGAVSVEILELLAASNLPNALPKGWDAADAEASGIRFDQIEVNARWVNIASPKSGAEGAASPGDADDSPLVEAKALILAAIERQPDDPGAVFEQDIAAAWNRVYDACQADYQRLRKLAKEAGASVIEIDKASNLRNRCLLGKTKTENKFQSNTSNTSNTSKASEAILSSTKVFQSSTSSTTALSTAPDALVRWTEKGQRLVIASDASLTVSGVLRGRFAYCTQAELWHAFGDAHWAPLIQSASLHEVFTRWLYPATGEIGFTPRYQDAILTLIQRANMLPLPLASHGVIPFQNGLLDLADRRLTEITPANALTWRLPYRYQASADCPKVKQWLAEAVNGDAETVQLLRAFMRALLLGGAYLQRFLHLIGPGGSGKSTFIRLMVTLIGESNTVSTDLKELEQNRFESANLYRKRLAIISDSDKYGGSINKLKAITGQDPLRLERKHVQQAGSFVFDGMVFLASNEALVTTDYTSGLERRRVTVNFDHRFSENEKTNFHAHGGEAALQGELPGLVNWLLDMTTEDMERWIKYPPKKTLDANDDAMRAGNPASDWLMECCVPQLGAWTQIGDKQERRDRETGKVTFDDATTKLYPNYLDWCQRNGRESLSLRRFRSVTMDMAKTLGADVLESRRGVGRGIQGLRLRTPGEEPICWRSDSFSS
jgi:putative DNA primase/helicase